MARKPNPLMIAMKFRRRALAYCRRNGLDATNNNRSNKELGRAVSEHAKLATKEELFALLEQEKGPFKVKRAPRLLPVKRMSDKNFFESREWYEARYKALKLHGSRCQCCGARRMDNVRIHVDHIKPRSKFPELQFEISNLQILCEPCNLGKGAWDETDWRDPTVQASDCVQ